MTAEPMLRLRANGLDFAALERGEAGAPVALLLHGFPETPHTFEPLMEALAGAGYRAVAPFMRGYAPTAMAPDGDYGLMALAADVPALLDALGAERAVVVGHDWGAAAGYLAAARHPERVTQLVALGIPHLSAVRPSLRLAWYGRHFVGLQWRRRAVARLRKDGGAFVDTLYRRWSPTWAFGPEETAPYKRMIAEHPEAIEGSVGYYWAFAAAQRDPARRKALQEAQRLKIGVPTLAITGGAEPSVLIEAYARAARRFTGPYEVAVAEGAGHFPHREAPGFVCEQVLAFLRATGTPA